MNILRKRPLSLILCIMLGGFSLFADFDIVDKLLIAAIPLVSSLVIFAFKDIKWSRNILLHISLFALCASVLLSALWSALYFPTEYYGETVDIDGRIMEIDSDGTYSDKVTVKCKSISGKKCNYTVICYFDKNALISNDIYSKISFTGKVVEFENGESGFDAKAYYTAQGCSAKVEDITEITVETSAKLPIKAYFDNLSSSIETRLKLLTNFETGALLTALITGNRNDLDGNTRLNFSRIGISHILALSGMHLAILSIAITRLLSILGVAKKPRTVILILITLFYMALTGFPSSVVRAGIMLIITGLLYLLSHRTDAVTSLFISVFLILVFSPHAVYDLSLWLSAFATLGVIVAAEIDLDKNDTGKSGKKILIWLRDGLMVSIFAFGATFAICLLRFDAFSIVSAITTMIFAPLIEVLVYGGLVLLVVGEIIPFGGILVFWADLIKELAELISDIAWIQVSANSFAVKLLIILFSIGFLAFMLLPIKNKRRAIAVLLIMLATTFAVAEVYTLFLRYDDKITYSANANGDIFLMRSGGRITLIYSGKQGDKGARIIAQYLNESGITYVDNLLIPNYTYTTPQFLESALDLVKIRRVILPKPTTDDEIGQAVVISDFLSLSGAEMVFTYDGETLVFGEYAYRSYNRNPYKYGEYPENAFQITADENKYAYVSACNYEELNAETKMLLFNSQNVFVGTVGNTKYYLFDMHLPLVKHIYYGDEGRIKEEADNFYKNKGASTQYVKTPIDIYD